MRACEDKTRADSGAESMLPKVVQGSAQSAQSSRKHCGVAADSDVKMRRCLEESAGNDPGIEVVEQYLDKRYGVIVIADPSDAIPYVMDRGDSWGFADIRTMDAC